MAPAGRRDVRRRSTVPHAATLSALGAARGIAPCPRPLAGGELPALARLERHGALPGQERPDTVDSTIARRFAPGLGAGGPADGRVLARQPAPSGGAAAGDARRRALPAE